MVNSHEVAQRNAAAMTLPHRPTKLRVVNTRLFDADVREIKRRARDAGVLWQSFFRSWVSRMLRRKEDVR